MVDAANPTEMAAVYITDAGEGKDAKVEITEGPQDTVVKAAFARLATAPTNWHQSTVFALATTAGEDKAIRRKAPLLFAIGVAMVVLQTTVVIGVFGSTQYTKCRNNDQCTTPGMFCDTQSLVVDRPDKCIYCGTYAPMPYQVDAAGNSYGMAEDRWFAGFNYSEAVRVCADPTLSRTAIGWAPAHTCFSTPMWRGEPPSANAHEEFAGLKPDKCWGAKEIGEPSPNYESYLASWCGACLVKNHKDGTGRVRSLTAFTLPAINTGLMSASEWAALVFCAILIGLAMVGEMKDIELCNYAIERAGNKLSLRWRRALLALNFIRRWTFLCPGLLLAIQFVVVMKTSPSKNSAEHCDRSSVN